MTTQEALDEYREIEEVWQCAKRLFRTARNQLMEVMGIPSRYTTLGRNEESSRGWQFNKGNVDYAGILSPSQRKRMRMLQQTMKGLK